MTNDRCLISFLAHVDQLIPLISCSSASLADRNKAEGRPAKELSTSVRGVKGSRAILGVFLIKQFPALKNTHIIMFFMLD